jgi:hypothetical protein
LPTLVKTEAPLARLPATNQLDLAIGLPLQHLDGLTNLLRQIYQRGSPQFHHYLTPNEFAAEFGPSASDYQSVVEFAKAQGLTVTGTHPNRTLVDVRGTVAAIENAFHVHMGVYRHPTENRTFFAPDTEPSMDISTPLLAISGLHNYVLPHSQLHRSAKPPTAKSTANLGSGFSGLYWWSDLRAAYLPGVSLTGTGQSVGLFELDGYNIADITNYESATGLGTIPLQNVLIDGFSGSPVSVGGESEVCLDIEMAGGFAPGLSNVLVYEGNPESSTTAEINDILNRMATDDAAQQLSCSWGFDINVSTDQIFQQFAAQGQTFFVASGDSGAYSGPVTEPCDDPNVTLAGATQLSTTGPLGSWVSETVWNVSTSGKTEASSGGVSAVYPIPFWQQGVNMSTNQGSTTMRNIPDVAMVGYNVFGVADGVNGEFSGTSLAAPLWAAFTALINQQGATLGQPPMGFMNPAIYTIGEGSNYSACFHDITTGNNTNSSSPTLYYAVPGYDLCTGWGTPTGSNLMNALLTPIDPLEVLPQLALTATGPVGGPFSPASRTYVLTNAGSAPLMWGLANTSLWLSATATSGTLAPGGASAIVTVGLSTNANQLSLGIYIGNIVFTDLSDQAQQKQTFALQVGNGGFETGDFTDWTLSNETSGLNLVINIDDGSVFGGLTSAQFVHSGLYGAFFAQTGSPVDLTQTFPVIAGQSYVLSFWLTSPAVDGSTTPNEFLAQWNGTTLFDQTDLGAFDWTNFQFLVTASNSTAVLTFGFRNDPAGFGFDDVSLQPIAPPTFQTVTLSGGTIYLTWTAIANVTYQLQFTTQLTSGTWTNLGVPITAVTNTVTESDSITSSQQRFYRVVII